ncbi:uncharacterized protein EI90DRAFT_2941968 [Cantharellus anzutake]|uniref:uncharacterized protein n=1 Tax=Cantharellus anzutake TaxID=1750568 RepID=UPI0019047B5C|nr:uncharacterized protein EI90DRAFT_2941968 [Cantharellus anzutake]KAF8318326.1 hypothetical protein EI90DRAFT_2941968 [Cantharellus anzutake]
MAVPSAARLILGLVFSLRLTPWAHAAVVISDPKLVSNKTYDYIVVGGGLAGLTVAGRLVQDPAVTVLVIEAGNDDRNDPRVFDIYQFGQAYFSSLDWSYPAEGGRSIRAGKTLGGSSSINGATWTRGTQAQYDALTQLLSPEDQSANLGWNWASLSSYMRKAEKFNPPSAAQRAKGADDIASYHGSFGPVNVAFPQKMYGGPQQKAFANTVVKFGVAKSRDLNGGQPNCVAFTPNSINPSDGDHRSSSASSYLTPVETKRKGWTVLVGQQATKIIFNPSTSLPRIATGVQFGTSNGARYIANARKEVIVAAGAIGSPAFLQFSGVGDPTALSRFGINTVVNLPTVGKNLQEQSLTAQGARGTGFNVGGSGPSDVIAFPNIYQLFGSSAQTMVTHIKSSLSAWASSQAGNALSAVALQKIYQIQANLIIYNNAPIAEIFSATGYPDKVGTANWPLLPFSRGNVRITSSNPFEKPQTTVNWFAIDFDLSVQVAIGRFVRRLFQTTPLSSLTQGETSPGFSAVPDNAQHGTDQAWSSWINNTFVAVSHPIATCAMMDRALGGVVDGHLLVYDTKNVRVIDASILPLQVSAHLSSTIYGIAEKAADIIKAAA